MTEAQKFQLAETLGTACGMAVLANEHLAESSRIFSQAGAEPPLILPSAVNRGQEFLNALRALMKVVQALPASRRDARWNETEGNP